MNARMLLAAAAATLACASCGFKGPLYLPQQNAAVVTHPAPANKVVPAPPPPAATKGQDKKQQTPATPPSGP